MTKAPGPPKQRASKAKVVKPTGIAALDRLENVEPVAITDYARAASEYVNSAGRLNDGDKKAGQIRLSNVLARALKHELEQRLQGVVVVAGERIVAGALRSVNADVSEIHPTDGLRLAIEIKPVNLAVGRAIWNRFGDIRTFAVNLHLKFPFCVVGGILTFPTFEEVGTSAAKKATKEELAAAETPATSMDVIANEEARITRITRRKDTAPLINRAISRLVRAGGRRTEGDAPHLLEAIAVVVYDPDTGLVVPDLPMPATGLRWEQFVDTLVDAYHGRFEGV